MVLPKGLSEMSTQVPHDMSHVVSYRRAEAAELDTTSYHHEVVCVELTTGSGYVLDLAGAQYGQIRPVITRKEHSDKYIIAVPNVQIGCSKFGEKAEHYRDRMSGAEGPYHEKLDPATKQIFEAQFMVVEDLYKSVGAWEQESGKSIRTLLTGSHGAFVQGLDELLEWVREDVEDEVDAIMAYLKDMIAQDTEKSSAEGGSKNEEAMQNLSL